MSFYASFIKLEINHLGEKGTCPAKLNFLQFSIQARPYLDMVAMFKELGFPTNKIHEALKINSCDQNKSLDYLTR